MDPQSLSKQKKGRGHIMVDSKLLAPCGLYCGVCGVLYASRENNIKFKEGLLGFYQKHLPGGEKLTIEDVHCDGCLSERPFVYCKECHIEECVRGKGYSGCHGCSDFPCRWIEDFPIAVGKRVILRAVPSWREMGTETWVEAEEARYTCPECGHKLFRGALRCHQCKAPVDLDG
jgi:hypothetical protein